MKTSVLAGCHFIFTILIILILAVASDAFKSPEHEFISEDAVNRATAAGAMDIGFYNNLLISWTWGIGQPLLGNPAEQLAHLEDQTQPFSATIYDGGNFADLLRRAQSQYLQFNFSSATAGSEGTYVLLGACVHLIEDQASMPHAANVLHAFGDKFESLPQLAGGFDGMQGNVSPSQSYINSLLTTQAKMPSYMSPSYSPPARYWWMNDELNQLKDLYYPEGNVTKIATRYQGENKPPMYPPLPDLWGEYGGIDSSGNPADIFSTSEQPNLYNQQGLQAEDFAEYFLVNISSQLPPLVQNLQADVQVITATTSMNVSFHAMTNKFPPLTYTATVYQGQTLIDVPISNVTVKNLVYGQNLPYEANVNFIFTGKELGQLLPSGNYVLDVRLKDAFGQTTPDAVNQDAITLNDTLLPFTVVADTTPSRSFLFRPGRRPI